MGGRLLAPLRSKAYRPEIDGLRAIAVLAVVIHHLQPHWLPGGFLGVDVFFVISGAVVTSSLLERHDPSAGVFLQGFYGRRFRRLLPALLAMVLLSSLMFTLVASPLEDGTLPSLRTGLAALFGVANLYLLRQSSEYFSADTHYNPFLHTWSLSVEEQYYLLWPWLVLACGLGRGGVDRGRLRRLAALTTVLLLASLVFYGHLNATGQPEQAFFLLPARFWELAFGCLAALTLALRAEGSEGRAAAPVQAGRRRRFGALAALLLLLAALTLPEGWRAFTSPAIALATTALLLLAHAGQGPGRLLAHPRLVALGLFSYSLYLWHWPLIVLLRWTLGLSPLTLGPLLGLIALATLLSYRLEWRCRFGALPAWAARRSWLAFPLLALGGAALLLPLQGPLRSRLYRGRPSLDSAQTSHTRRIEGTTISTASCFLDPEAPLLAPGADRLCRTAAATDRPTVFFEGDSHTHSLIPLGALLVRHDAVGVSFLARGGCSFPYFEPWHQNRHQSSRYRRCRDHARQRQEALAAQLQPGDRLVLSLAYPNYFGPDSASLTPAMAGSYSAALEPLARLVAARGAQLVLFEPLPSFPQPVITAPLSLCQREWFRPSWALLPACAPLDQPRRQQLARTAAIRQLQQQFQQQLRGRGLPLELFDPFPSLCPPQQANCSTKADGLLLYQDGSHLSTAGAQRLHPAFRRLLPPSASSVSLR